MMEFGSPPQVYNLLRKEFGFKCKTDTDSNIHILHPIEIESCEIVLDNVVFPVIFKIMGVGGSAFVSVSVSHNHKKEIIKCLEHIDGKIDNLSFQKDFVTIVSYNSVSEYYCNLIYPRLNRLERTLRELLFNIYILNFGESYYKTTTSDKLQTEIKGKIQPKGSKDKKETQYLKEFFYNIDYSDINTLLFEKRWLAIDGQKHDEFLSNHADLSTLADWQLREAFSDLRPKSDWERLFANKVTDPNIDQLINNLRIYRNNIAHCKVFSKVDYLESTKLISYLQRVLNKALILTERIDFYNKYNEEISTSIKRLSESIARLNQTVSTSLVSSVSEFVKTMGSMAEHILSNAAVISITLSDANPLESEERENDEY